MPSSPFPLIRSIGVIIKVREKGEGGRPAVGPHLFLSRDPDKNQGGKKKKETRSAGNV